MKKIFFIILYIIMAVFAQDTMWVKTFDHPSDSIFGYIPINFFRIGEEYLLVNYFYGAEMGFYLIEANESGDTVWTKKYTSESAGVFYSGIRSASKTIDNNFVCFSNIALFKFDENGDSIFMQTYEDLIEWGAVVTTTDDGNLIFGGKSPLLSCSIRIVKTDSLGNILLFKDFPAYEPPWGGCYWSIFIEPVNNNNEFLILNGPLVYKCNNDLDTIWTRNYNYWFLGIADAIELADSNYLFVGGPAGIMKVSYSTGEVLGFEAFPPIEPDHSMTFSYITETLDNNYIVGAYCFHHGAYIDGISYLVKIDSLWNQLWYQFISDSTVNRVCVIKQIIQHPDSSYFAIGTATVPEDSFRVCLIKLRYHDTTDVVEEKTITPENLETVSYTHLTLPTN